MATEAGRVPSAGDFRLEDILEATIATTPRSEPLVPAIVGAVRRYYAHCGHLGQEAPDAPSTEGQSGRLSVVVDEDDVTAPARTPSPSESSRASAAELSTGPSHDLPASGGAS